MFKFKSERKMEVGFDENNLTTNFLESRSGNIIRCQNCNGNYTNNVSQPQTFHEESRKIKCMRKKYKCIIIWLITVTSVCQFLYLIFDKLDERFLNRFTEKVLGFIKSNQNTTNSV